jgi:hypothetical protein
MRCMVCLEPLQGQGLYHPYLGDCVFTEYIFSNQMIDVGGFAVWRRLSNFGKMKLWLNTVPNVRKHYEYTSYPYGVKHLKLKGTE